MKVLVFLLIALHRLAAQEPEFVDVFLPATDAYSAIRIPSVITTKQGSVLAFAEGRKKLNDQSENDIISKRSTDGGRTWSARKLIHDDGANSLNNPTAIVEQQSGRIFLMFQPGLTHGHPFKSWRE